VSFGLQPVPAAFLFLSVAAQLLAALDGGRYMSEDQLMTTYGRQPVAFVRGEGAWLIDESGRRYLDAISGIAVCNLGHAHPAIGRAIADQASTLMHTSNLYRIPLQEELAGQLCAATGMERAFFCNSGAEANEAAIKLARLHGHRRNIQNPTIIVAEGSFHGRTLATLTATGNRKVQAGFEPLVHGFLRVPYDDLEALDNVARNDPNVVAILIEPIQGEGGVRLPSSGYLAALRERCDQHQWLLMLDEVQTGMGRTGHLLASQGSGVAADVVTLAKGLGNGFPIGACLARGEAATLFKPGNHGSTFGGSPLACRVALTVVQTLLDQQLPVRAGQLGRRILDRLEEHLAGLPGVVSIRGAGLMIGIELDRPCGELVELGREAGLLINVTAERIVRLLPPLIISDDEADQLADGVADLVRGALAV
jgi:acetylornithine/N-succinyldiaminopimelate aminotransferase